MWSCRARRLGCLDVGHALEGDYHSFGDASTLHRQAAGAFTCAGAEFAHRAAEHVEQRPRRLAAGAQRIEVLRAGGEAAHAHAVGADWLGRIGVEQLHQQLAQRLVLVKHEANAPVLIIVELLDAPAAVQQDLQQCLGLVSVAQDQRQRECGDCRSRPTVASAERVTIRISRDEPLARPLAVGDLLGHHAHAPAQLGGPLPQQVQLGVHVLDDWLDEVHALRIGMAERELERIQPPPATMSSRRSSSVAITA